MDAIDTRERLILALDLDEAAAARKLVEQLGNSVGFYKLGLELFMAGGYFDLLDWLLARDKKVFVDLKFFDVPRTVGRAVRALSNSGAFFATVHGNDGMIEAAVENRGDLKILAVTALTSLDQHDLDDLGFQCDAESLVLSRARRALQLGCDGIVCSGQEAAAVRAQSGTGLALVTPGIRPLANVDDQKRTVDVEQAFANGADYIVMGRPIVQAADPRAAAEAVQARIGELFAGGSLSSAP